MPRCTDCELNLFCDYTKIDGTGKTPCDIMVINSVSKYNDEANQIATIDNTVKNMLLNNGIKNYYYTNAIKCFPPKGSTIKVAYIKQCAKHLLREFEIVKPKFVLLIGAQAVQMVLNRKISEVSGAAVIANKITYVAALNPAIIFREPSKALIINKSVKLFSDIINGNIPEKSDLNIKIITNINQLKSAFVELNKSKFVSYDIETTGLNRFKDDINAVGFGTDKVQYIIPGDIDYSPNQGKNIRLTTLYKNCVENLKTKKGIAGNGKFDNLFLEHHIGSKPNLSFDVVLGSHILDENSPNNVKENSIIHLNALEWDLPLPIKLGQFETKKDYDNYIEYLGYDIHNEYLLGKKFIGMIKGDPSLWRLYKHLYMPVIKAYEQIEKEGFLIDQDQFNVVESHLNSEIKRVEKKLSKYKKNTNWLSSKQLIEFLYDELKLPILKTTPKGKPSTDEDTLTQLMDKHPSIELILENKGYHQQKSFFIDGWKSRMVNGKLHPSYKMLTVTGRTSCTDPNMQQVTRDPIIRNLIVAPDNYLFVEADLSQAELRIAAMVANDEEMKRIYRNNGDIHTHTYEIISGQKISDDKHTRKSQRHSAKAVNFGEN